jgi:serine protease AprX
VNAIVQFNTAPNADDLKQLASYGQVKQLFTGINAAAILVPAGNIASIAANPNVKFITPDRAVKSKLDLTGAAVNAATAVSYGLDGTGVGIAIIDSGITVRDDLKKSGGAARIVHSEDLTGLGSTNDGYGHGTHVAGIAAGNGAASKKSAAVRSLQGIAPNANIINLRVLDSNGQGNDSSVIAAIERAIALKSGYNIRVINLSLGRGVFESYTLDPLCQEVEAAWRAGIVVVAAAGNQGRNNNGGVNGYGGINGYGTIEAPGNDPFVITVGAMNTVGTPSRVDDKMTSYSSKGPTLYDHIVKPDIVAPGNHVVSVLSSATATLFTQMSTTQLPNSYYIRGGTGISTDYYILNGTSMATPVVSGAAALLIQQNPSITPDQVKARLMKTAYKSFPTVTTTTDAATGTVYTSYYDIFTVGAGYLDIQMALANTDQASRPAKSPAVKFNSATGTVSLVTGTNVVGNSGFLVGDRAEGLGAAGPKTLPEMGKSMGVLERRGGPTVRCRPSIKETAGSCPRPPGKRPQRHKVPTTSGDSAATHRNKGN